MITTRCPKCGNETRVPDSIVGKKVRCKDPACGQVYAAVEYPDSVLAAAPVAAGPVMAPANPADLFRPSLPEPEWDIPEEPAPTEKRSSSRGKGSTQKYPNLIKYLGYVQTSALVQLVVLLFLASIVLLVSILTPLIRKAPFDDVIIAVLTGGLSATLIGMVAYSLYVFTMAGVDFVKVIIDIEANTRHTASQSGD